jgi:hypothetical protein
MNLDISLSDDLCLHVKGFIVDLHDECEGIQVVYNIVRNPVQLHSSCLRNEVSGHLHPCISYKSNGGKSCVPT